MTREEYNGMTQRQMADHTRAHYANQQRKEIDGLTFTLREMLVRNWGTTTLLGAYPINYDATAEALAAIVRGQQGA